MTRLAPLALGLVTLLAGCPSSPPAECAAGPMLGCPCDGSRPFACEVRPTLACVGGAWGLVADACGERDAGRLPDAGRDAAVADAPRVDAGNDSGPPGTATFGEECENDGTCASGVCWDAHDADPYCFGRGCSLPCTTDGECIDAATTAGASAPGAAICDTARSECDLGATGLVAIACA